MGTSINMTTPVGRLVAGSLYKGNDKNAEGAPLVTKTGPNAGQPRLDFYFGIAIPKGAEQHWAQTEWGAKIYSVGNTCFPNVAQSPKFAWKITDGDSQIPNTKGKKPCDREGFPGHWILSCSSGYAPKIYNRDGSQVITEADAVKLGYYIQVNLNVDGNGSTQQPGIYLNHSMVAFAAYGEEIVIGPDATQAGFGASPLPAGATVAPVGAAFNPAAMPVLPPAGVMPAPPTMMPQIPVVPNPAFLAPAVPVTPPLPVAPVRVMLPAAQGATYEAMIANGWTDALLIQHGMMQG